MRTSIRSTFSAVMILITVLLLNISAAFAQWETKITADDAEEEDQFGYSVSISGDYAVIGAYYDDDGGSGSGCAFIFFGRQNWASTIDASNSNVKLIGEASNDYFGVSVSPK